MSIGRWLPAHRRDFHSRLCSAWVLQFAVSAFRSVSAAFTLAFVRRGFYNAKLDDAASQSHPFHSSLCSAWVLQCSERSSGYRKLRFHSSLCSAWVLQSRVRFDDEEIRDFHSSLCSAWVLQLAASRAEHDLLHSFHSSLCSAWVLQFPGVELVVEYQKAFTLAFVRRGFYNQRALPPLVIKESFHSSLCSAWVLQCLPSAT